MVRIKNGIKLCQAFGNNMVDAISLMPNNLYGPGDNYILKIACLSCHD